MNQTLRSRYYFPRPVDRITSYVLHLTTTAAGKYNYLHYNKTSSELILVPLVTADTVRLLSPKPMLNFSLPSYSELFQATINNVQPHPHPLRSSPSPPPPVPAKSLLRLRTENPEPVFHCLAQSKPGYHPHPLLSNPPERPLRDRHPCC
jgi:hypothetical protein